MAIYNSQQELISTLLSQSQGTAMSSMIQSVIGSIYLVSGDDAEYDPANHRINIGENNRMALAAFVHEYTHMQGWSAFQAAMDAAMAANDRDRAILLAGSFEAQATAAEALYLGTEGFLNTLGAGGAYMKVDKLIELYQYCAAETGYSKQNQAPVADMYQCLVDGATVYMPYVFSAAYADAYRSQWSVSNGGNGAGYGGGGGAGWGGFFPNYNGMRNAIVIPEHSVNNDVAGSMQFDVSAAAGSEGALQLIQALASFTSPSVVVTGLTMSNTKADEPYWQLAVA